MSKRKGDSESTKAAKKVLRTYGLPFEDGQVSQLEIELLSFVTRRDRAQGGLGRFGHLKNIIDEFWPKTQWHEWTTMRMKGLCDYTHVGWAGCGASGKTYDASKYAMSWWAAYPHDSAVILTSTTAKMIRKRQWAAIQDLLYQCDGFPGHVVDSKTIIQARPGDDKHGIFAIAVGEGSVSKAVANIQGIHAKRMLVIIDEGTDTPGAIFEACSNLSKGCSEFQQLVIGNPHSFYDEHGKFCEPKDGWKSVNVETEEWETARGICQRFDGLKSPNIRARKNIYPFLITVEDVKNAMEFEGESSPRFWKYTRGFWAPDGVSHTVVSEQLCLKYDVELSAVFDSKFTVIGALDPAFGGDRCVLRFGKLGARAGDGKMTLYAWDIVVVKIDAKSEEPVAYQIAASVKKHCEARGCDPENFIADATGNGEGVCDVICKEWGQITRVKFGEVASDIPASDYNGKPGNECYADRVTELWYSVREWISNDQIRGLDKSTISEFCARYYEVKKGRVEVEPKKTMKNRTGKSPDFADAFSLLVDKARQIGGKHKSVVSASNSWNKMAESANAIYDRLYV